MIKIKIINVGTNKESYFREGIDEYLKRLSAYASVETVSVPETKLSQNPKDGEIKSALEKERILIEKLIPPGSLKIGLCIEGKPISSVDFATLLQSKTKSYSKFVFIIGGSFGLSESLKNSLDYKMSFSPMTFPHTLAKLILCEQLYRAFSIMNGGKYHK